MAGSTGEPPLHGTSAQEPDDVVARILTALKGLRFGAVEIQVHDAHVVRITRTEKFVVESPRAKGASERSK